MAPIDPRMNEMELQPSADLLRDLQQQIAREQIARAQSMMPDHVPQWCSKHWLKAGHRKGGGKRRKASLRPVGSTFWWQGWRLRAPPLFCFQHQRSTAVPASLCGRVVDAVVVD